MTRPQKLKPSRLIGWKTKNLEFMYTENEVILYALSIGFNQDPLRVEDFKYTYQRDDQFTIFPTITGCLGKYSIFEVLDEIQQLPQSFNSYNILHGFHRIEFIHPRLKTNTRYVIKGQVIDIQDKGKMSLMVIQFKFYQILQNGKQDLAAINYFGPLLLGIGGFGYPGNNFVRPIPKKPQNKPDYILYDTTFLNQAFFYRLNADLNPLHVDPKAASMLGFKAPILHGLASFGVVARCLVQNLLNNDPTQMRSYECRFTGHVFPGQKFEIKVWKFSTYFIFSVYTVERGTQALRGYLQFKQKPKL